MPKIERAWFYDNDEVYLVRVLNRGAHASFVEYHANGLEWQIIVPNDDIEFIGDETIDDDED